MQTYLNQIIQLKKQEVEQAKIQQPIHLLQQQALYKRQKISAKKAIVDPDKTGIIAEFKRKSPSKGYIHENAEIDKIIPQYEKAGASMISILTNRPFFGAQADDFTRARELSTIPLLRKEFIIDAYQLHESKAMGADVILLIASCLDKKEIATFTQIAHDLDMEVLLEIHTEKQLETYSTDIDLVGINNRNLETFEVDLAHSRKLLAQLPTESIKIAESGLDSPETVLALKNSGFHGFLIGERFMKTDNPGESFAQFNLEIIQPK